MQDAKSSTSHNKYFFLQMSTFLIISTPFLASQKCAYYERAQYNIYDKSYNKEALISGWNYEGRYKVQAIFEGVLQWGLSTSFTPPPCTL